MLLRWQPFVVVLAISIPFKARKSVGVENQALPISATVGMFLVEGREFRILVKSHWGGIFSGIIWMLLWLWEPVACGLGLTRRDGFGDLKLAQYKIVLHFTRFCLTLQKLGWFWCWCDFGFPHLPLEFPPASPRSSAEDLAKGDLRIRPMEEASKIWKN